MPWARARAPYPRPLVFFLAVALIAGGCAPRTPSAAASAAPSARQAHALEAAPGIPGASLAEAAVRRTYEALASKDQDKTLHSLEPAARPGEHPGSQLSVAFGLFRLSGDILATLSFEDVRYAAVRSDGTWAEVRVRGLIRNAALATATPLDSTEVAHQVDGRWYTSLPELYASNPAGADYAARIQTLNREGCH